MHAIVMTYEIDFTLNDKIVVWNDDNSLWENINDIEATQDNIFLSILLRSAMYSILRGSLRRRKLARLGLACQANEEYLRSSVHNYSVI